MDVALLLNVLGGLMVTVTGNHRYMIDTEYDISDNLHVMQYLYYKERIPWNSARIECQRQGGDLAKVDSSIILDHVKEIALENYGENFFDDYWTGLIQPESGDYFWVSDCSSLTYTDNVAAGWKGGEQCIKMHHDHHTGVKAKCQDSRAFICQIPTNDACPIFSRLTADLLDTSNSTDCQATCMSHASCTGTVDVTNSTCFLMTHPLQGTTPIEIATRFCVNVSRSLDKPPKPNNNAVPVYNCSLSNTPISPTPVSSVTTTVPVSPSFSMICFSTPVIVNLTETVNVTVTESITVTDMESINVTVTESLNVTVTESINVTDTESINVTVTESINVTATESINVTVTESINVTVTESINITVTENITFTENVTYTETQHITIPPVTLTQQIGYTASVVVETCNVTGDTGTINITIEEAELLANEIHKNLTIDTKSTHAYLRTKISVDDPRTSAQTMGYIGTICVILPIVLMILTDIRKIISGLQLYENVYT